MTGNYDITTPVFVIGSKDDLLFPGKDVIKTAKAYNVKPVILSGMCHDMQLDKEWEKSADEIHKFIIANN